MFIAYKFIATTNKPLPTSEYEPTLYTKTNERDTLILRTGHPLTLRQVTTSRSAKRVRVYGNQCPELLTVLVTLLRDSLRTKATGYLAANSSN